MDEQIMSREALEKRIREKAYIAFVRRAGRDSHCMNHGAPAIADFQAEYDRLESEAKTLPRSHTARAPVRRFDLPQSGKPKGA